MIPTMKNFTGTAEQVEEYIEENGVRMAHVQTIALNGLIRDCKPLWTVWFWTAGEVEKV